MEPVNPHPPASYPSRATEPDAGFALATVLIALVGLTALSVGGFLMANASFTVSQNQRTSVTALYLADTGLERFLATHQGPVPTSPVTYSYPEGTARVTLDPLREVNPLQSVWLITSEGRHPLPKGGAARRTVHTVAVLDANTFRFPSAFSSASGITKNGTSGRIDGHDQSGAGACPAAGAGDTNGVATPQSDPYRQNGGPTPVPTGSPKDTMLTPTARALIDSTGVDWAGVVSGQRLQFDYTIPPDGWPDFSSLPSGEWPVIYVDNKGSDFDVDPSHSGRGTLVVRGDLTMNGNFTWKGPIMVGGSVTSSNGAQQVQGGLTSGFNVTLGEPVSQTAIGNGQKDFLYHACNNHSAMRHTATFVQDPGTWFESW